MSHLLMQLGWQLLSASGLLDPLVPPGMAYHIIARINEHPKADPLAQVLSTLDESTPASERSSALSWRWHSESTSGL